MITKLIEIINRVPNEVPINKIRYYVVLRLMSAIGFFVHTFWLFMFWFIGVPEMACFNVLSISFFAIGFLLVLKQHYFIGLLFPAVEISLHNTYATYLTGLETRFYLFLMVGAILPMFLPKGKTCTKILIGFIPVFCLIFVNEFIVGKQAVYQLPDLIVTFLSISNILISVFLVQMFSGYFGFAVYQTEEKLDIEREKTNNLLHNILPIEIANELKESGKVEAQQIENVTIIFTDFKGFTALSEKLTSNELVNELNTCFTAFDKIIRQYKLEKIKTIGDAYMAAGGLQGNSQTAIENSIKAALAMQQFMVERKHNLNQQGKLAFEMRAGVNTGQVTTGVVGEDKFQYDLWGDAVNTAARMESNGAINKVNISKTTYESAKDNSNFNFIERESLAVKGKGEMKMYFVELV